MQLPLPLKLAIVGGGPSAFYVASRLLQQLPQISALGAALRIHIYDRLWAPHGLVRYGVAPDHPEVKNCTHKFDEAARDPRVRFFGNVNVGSTSNSPHTGTRLDEINLPLSRLMPHYSHLLLANGCPNPRLHPALYPPSTNTPPSTSENDSLSMAAPLCRPALDLVHWYTSHPSSPSPPDLSQTSHVTVIGHGNVALDVARMLLSSLSRLASYDVPNSVLEVLKNSQVRHVSIIGRRGPLQAAFSPRELREMMSLDDVSFVPLAKDLIETAESEIAQLEGNDKHRMQNSGGEELGVGVGISRAQKRMLGMLQAGSRAAIGSTAKTFSIEFFRTPTGISYSSASRTIREERPKDRAVSLQFGHTVLDSVGASARAIPTGESSVLHTDLVLTSLGYIPDTSFFLNSVSTSVGEQHSPTVAENNPSSGWLATPGLSHVRNALGRILDTDGRIIKNAYVSGWAASGAKGVLARTVEDARGVAAVIVEDYLKSQDIGNGVVPEEPLTGGPSDISLINQPGGSGDLLQTSELNSSPKLSLASVPSVVQSGLDAGIITTYDDWLLIDAEEIRRGKGTVEGEERKERERMDWPAAKVFLKGFKDSAQAIE